MATEIETLRWNACEALSREYFLSAATAVLWLLFRLGPSEIAPSATYALVGFFVGLALVGAIYALVALGLLFIFNAARIVNFAQGQLLMVGAFLAVTSVVDCELPPLVEITLYLADTHGGIVDFSTRVDLPLFRIPPTPGPGGIVPGNIGPGILGGSGVTTGRK